MPQRVSVVIPVFNGAVTLERCLAALAAQSEPPLEIIVADNGSHDDSCHIVQRWIDDARLPLRLIRVARRGAAAARNAAVREARGEWIAFTDGDCLPEPDWMRCGAALAASCGADIAALAGPARGTLEGDGAARLLGLTTLSAGRAEHQTEQIYADAGPTGMQGFAAANLWVRRAFFLDIGGFDEALTASGEDMDLCARLYAGGGRLLFSPALRVRHVHAPGILPMWRKMASYGRAHAGLFRRYGRAGIHLELPMLGPRRIPCRCYAWCNLGSAEKKLLLLLALGLWAPAWLWLVPAYLVWLALFLRRRAAALGAACSWPESLWLGMLLVVKSAAVSWGRVRGSRCGVWAC